MRHREHSDEAIILGSGASTNEAIRWLGRLSAPAAAPRLRPVVLRDGVNQSGAVAEARGAREPTP